MMSASTTTAGASQLWPGKISLTGNPAHGARDAANRAAAPTPGNQRRTTSSRDRPRPSTPHAAHAATTTSAGTGQRCHGMTAAPRAASSAARRPERRAAAHGATAARTTVTPVANALKPIKPRPTAARADRPRKAARRGRPAAGVRSQAAANAVHAAMRSRGGTSIQRMAAPPTMVRANAAGNSAASAARRRKPALPHQPVGTNARATDADAHIASDTEIASSPAKIAASSAKATEAAYTPVFRSQPELVIGIPESIPVGID